MRRLLLTIAALFLLLVTLWVVTRPVVIQRDVCEFLQQAVVCTLTRPR